MADPGVSTQNFLRLLLGGAQKGVDQRFVRQGQEADLALQLQGMLQRKQLADEELAQRGQFRREDVLARKEDDARQREYLDIAKRNAGREEYRDSETALSGHLKRIQELQAETQRNMLFTKLAQQHPELASVFELLQASKGDSSIDDAMRVITAKGKPAPTPEEVLHRRTLEYMKIFAQDPPLDEDGNNVDLYQYSRQKAQQELQGSALSGDVNDLSVEEIQAEIDRLQGLTGGAGPTQGSDNTSRRARRIIESSRKK